MNHDSEVESKDVLRLRFYLVFSRKEITPTSYNNTKQSGIFRQVIQKSSRSSPEANTDETTNTDLSDMMQVTATNVNTGKHSELELLFCRLIVDDCGQIKRNRGGGEGVKYSALPRPPPL